MLLSATISKAELCALVASATPLRVTIDERRGRSLVVERPAVELVPDRGLRLRGAARIAWDALGVPITVTIQTWELFIVPRITSGKRGRLLLFEPVLGDLDLKLVPGFLEGKIAQAIGEGLAKTKDKFAWNFARTLERSFALSPKITSIGTFEITTGSGDVTVTSEEVRIRVILEASTTRRRATNKAGEEEEMPAPSAPTLAPAR